MFKKEILIVEGDIMLSERLKQKLQAEGYLVDTVYKGIV